MSIYILKNWIKDIFIGADARGYQFETNMYPWFFIQNGNLCHTWNQDMTYQTYHINENKELIVSYPDYFPEPTAEIVDKDLIKEVF